MDEETKKALLSMLEAICAHCHEAKSSIRVMSDELVAGDVRSEMQRVLEISLRITALLQ